MNRKQVVRVMRERGIQDPIAAGGTRRHKVFGYLTPAETRQVP
ncbi:hypothetical protein N4G69_25040 [Streptomyces mirabilis]|nr:hypothetical protein [Streptomyces mirabilis]MCT9108845.1 hypothetical protein [Streptomyces mirabilis]